MTLTVQVDLDGRSVTQIYRRADRHLACVARPEPLACRDTLAVHVPARPR